MKLNWPESPEKSFYGFSFDFMSKNKPFPCLSKTSVLLLLEIQKSDYNSNQPKRLSLQSCNEMRTTKFFIAPTIAPVIQKKHTSISFKAKSFDRNKYVFFTDVFLILLRKTSICTESGNPSSPIRQFETLLNWCSFKKSSGETKGKKAFKLSLLYTYPRENWHIPWKVMVGKWHFLSTWFF